MDSDGHIGQLEARGYAIIEGAIEPALCDEIIAEIERLAVSRERAAGFSHELQGLIGYDTSARSVGHVDAGSPPRLLAATAGRAGATAAR